MEKPTILIVGGAWHTVDYLRPLAITFEDEGYPTRSLGLPSVGASPPADDFSGDVAAVRSIATGLIAENKSIIAVLHSLGGISGTEALHGLGKSSTGGAGVIALVYIASMVPKKGNCFDEHLEALGDLTWKPARESFTQEGMMALPAEFAASMFYNDLDESSAKHWTSLLKAQSVGVYDSALTHETYKEIPSGYLLTTQDQAFKHDYQLKTVEMAGFLQNKMKTMETGHMPFLTMPEEVKQFVLRIAHEAKE